MFSRRAEILIATSNLGKAREITRALGLLPFKMRTLKEFHFVRPVEETGESYQENATAKALGYAAQTGLYALADDSGLEVDSLRGGPGVRSARFGGSEISDVERNHMLLMSLGHTSSSRRARFVCVSVLAEPSRGGVNSARILAVTNGVCQGKISYVPRGMNGFGYDSVFIPNGHDLTFGELSDSIKDRISHRAQALFQMRNFLKTLNTRT